MSAILLIAIPLLAAFLSMIIKKAAPMLLMVVSTFSFIAVFFIASGDVVIGGFLPPLGIALLVDNYARLALLLVNGLILIITLLTIKSYSQYSQILLLVIAGLNGLILTNDLFNLFVFLEISAIGAYLITTSNQKPLSTFRYLMMGAVGSALFLLGVTILYAMFGTLNMVDMIRQINASNHYQELILPFTLMFIGLGVEAKLLPFNAWVRGVLGNSNVFSGPMIAGVYAGAMTFVLGRLLTNLFVLEGRLLTVVTIILIAGVVLGDVMAFASSKTREILLFSSIAQASIITLLFVNGIVIWAVYLIIANALSKTLMFMVINKAEETAGSDEADDLRGLFRHNLLIGVAFTIGTLSLMGLPLLVGFTIKLSYLTELAQSDQFWLIALILLASVVEAVYFVRLLLKLWYPGKHQLRICYHWSLKMVFVMIALALLLFGTYRKPLEHFDNSIDTVMEVVNHG